MKTLNEKKSHCKHLEQKWSKHSLRSLKTCLHLRGSGKTSEIKTIVQFILKAES